MKVRNRYLLTMAGVWVPCLALAAALLWATTGGWPVVAQGSGTFFNSITVNGDIDVYGTGVIRDSLSNTVRTQVTSGGVTVAGATDSPNIYGGYNGNAVGGGVQGSFIGAGGSASENWIWLRRSSWRRRLAMRSLSLVMGR